MNMKLLWTLAILCLAGWARGDGEPCRPKQSSYSSIGSSAIVVIIDCTSDDAVTWELEYTIDPTNDKVVAGFAVDDNCDVNQASNAVVESGSRNEISTVETFKYSYPFERKRACLVAYCDQQSALSCGFDVSGKLTPDSTLSVGAIVGIAVGGAAALIILIVLVTFFAKRNSRKSTTSNV